MLRHLNKKVTKFFFFSIEGKDQEDVWMTTLLGWYCWRYGRSISPLLIYFIALQTNHPGNCKQIQRSVFLLIKQGDEIIW